MINNSKCAGEDSAFQFQLDVLSRSHATFMYREWDKKKVKEKWTAEIDEEFRLSLIFNVSPSPGVRYRKWSYRRKEICVFVTRARELSGGRIFWSWTFSESLVWVCSQCVGGIYFSLALFSPISIHVYYVVKTQRYLSLLFELSSLPPQAQQQKFSSRKKPFLFHAWIFNTPVLCGKKQKKAGKRNCFSTVDECWRANLMSFSFVLSCLWRRKSVTNFVEGSMKVVRV